VTPAHSSPFTAFSGSSLRGNPRIPALSKTRPSWVSTIHPHHEAPPSRGNTNNPYKPLRKTKQFHDGRERVLRLR
jgi:hypothetical protein